MRQDDLAPEDAQVPALAPWTAPGVEVTSHRVIVRDGWYNAFCDLVRWKDYYWLSYRRGTGHGGGHSMEVILRSSDLRRWLESAVFEPVYGIDKGWGGCDGHFATTGERLYFFFRAAAPILGSRVFSSWTEDGVSWSDQEVMRKDDGYPFIWRVRHREDRFYSAVANLNERGEARTLDLLMSQDAAHWTRHAMIAAEPPESVPYFTEESDLYWQPDGELWCVVRCTGACLYWSKPPYTQWEGGVRLHGCAAPAICSCNGQVYVAGRGIVKVVPKPDEIGGQKGTTAIYRLTKEGTEPVASFPAAGDASYPGLICPEPGKLIIAFYSDVIYQCGQVKPRYHPEYQYKRTACDIFLAELQVG